ncbi:MAG: hypothetical protein LC746_15430 [Acidobacteria bacterium]|nr:hypothetical protein [Acidobacteriota bacterium]
MALAHWWEGAPAACVAEYEHFEELADPHDPAHLCPARSATSETRPSSRRPALAARTSSRVRAA